MEETATPQFLAQPETQQPAMEETAIRQFLAQPETQQPAMEETAIRQFLAQPETQQPAMEETAIRQFLAQPETQQPAMEEKSSDQQCSNIKTEVEHGQNDEGGKSAAESHCVGLETPSNRRSEAISSSRQSQLTGPAQGVTVSSLTLETIFR